MSGDSSESGSAGPEMEFDEPGSDSHEDHASDRACNYQFNPSEKTEANLQTTWECPHPAHEDSNYCLFHMRKDERLSRDVTPDDIIDQLVENLKDPDPRKNEYVGADLPHLPLTYQDINGDTNHILNFQYANIDGIDISYGRLDQGLNLREATVGELKLQEATVSGVIEAHELTVTGQVIANETEFQDDVHFRDGDFQDDVSFDEASFLEDSSFENATFHSVAHFRNAETNGTSHVLDDNISFKGADFRDDASFRQATFKYVSFVDATFQADADFDHADFGGNAAFSGCEFSQEANFNEARFDDDADFEDVQFKGLAEFRGVEFRGGSRTTSDDVTFEDATFSEEADFKLAHFRYSNFGNATFKSTLNFDRAKFEERTDAHGIMVAGPVILENAHFAMQSQFEGSVFKDTVDAVKCEFDGDAEFYDVEFKEDAKFTEARFREDVSFRGSTFHEASNFNGAMFEGEAQHLEENASFREVSFEQTAQFKSATFTTASFWDATFNEAVNFREAVFKDALKMRAHSESNDTYVDLTDAVVNGGRIVESGGDIVPYDLTRTKVGDIQLEGEGSEHELLDHFRFCLTEFNQFDFSNHHSALERNDWNIHDFVGESSRDQYAVEMTPEVIEETYRNAKDSAEAVGDTPAKREFEFKRYYFDRKKNIHILTNEYALNSWSRLKKLSSVGLNAFMQFTCGYGNRLPRIAALTFLLPAVYGAIYTLPGPFETQANNLFDAMYYSYISFSTIGYGDIGPIGWAAKLMAMSQGMLNGVFFTLFTITLLNRVMGNN